MIGFLFSRREWELCVLPTCAYGTLLPKMHHAFFVLIFVRSNFSASFFLFLFFLYLFSLISFREH